MRTGAEYRQSLRDGRRVWVMGEGLIDDITTHPATRAMVDEYVAWYDRHADPAWADTVLGADGTPLSYLSPKSSGRSRPHGTLLFRHDVSQRWQHHAHAGLWPPDRSRHSRHRAGAQCLSQADRRCSRLSRHDQPDRTVPHLLRRRRHHRLSDARGSRPARRLPYRARDRRGFGDQRQDRHAHQSRICRGGFHRRRPDGHRDRLASRHIRRPGWRAGRHHGLPQDRGARRQSVRRPAVQPLRRAGWADVAG